MRFASIVGTSGMDLRTTAKQEKERRRKCDEVLRGQKESRLSEELDEDRMRHLGHRKLDVEPADGGSSRQEIVFLEVND